MLKNTFCLKRKFFKIRDKPAHTCRRPLPLVQWYQIHRRKKKKLLQNQRIGGKVKSKIFGTAGTNEAGGIKDQKKKRRNEER